MNPQEKAEKKKRISQDIDLSRTYPSNEGYDILYDMVCNKEKYNGMKITYRREPDEKECAGQANSKDKAGRGRPKDPMIYITLVHLHKVAW